MPRFEDEADGRKQPRYSLSLPESEETLNALSIEEIDERILAFRAEIGRLEAKKRSKEASRRSADAFFKS